MTKDTSEYFLGIFFTTSLLYFIFLFIALKEKKHLAIGNIYSRDSLGEENLLLEKDSNLIDLK